MFVMLAGKVHIQQVHTVRVCGLMRFMVSQNSSSHSGQATQSLSRETMNTVNPARVPAQECELAAWQPHASECGRPRGTVRFPRDFQETAPGISFTMA